MRFPLMTLFISFIIIAEALPNKRMYMSEYDRFYIDALVAEENTLSPKKRHICNGRFLTMHKRRRKRLQTRSLAFEPAVLDDILHGQVSCILRQVGNWRFNAFTLETVTGGNYSFYDAVKSSLITATFSLPLPPSRTIVACSMCSLVSFVRPFGPFQSRCS